MIDIKKYTTSLNYDDIKEGEQCQVACPLQIDMPNYYNLMDRGKYEDAYMLLKAANPFPSITGRVCFFPCEYGCVRGKLDTPVAIREVEYFLSDYIQLGPNKKPELAVFKEGSKKGTRKESVAIIGSGPAGMAAAWDLAHSGYKVTIYEKQPLCGGMMHLGIPLFKILREVFDYEIEVLKKIGVNIINNMEIGKDKTIEELMNEGVSAICIAVGADVGNKLKIPGSEECNKVYESTEVLKHVRMGGRKKLGEKVLIIGGGNTAMDISRTCLRLGTKNVTIACLESRETMPAYDYEIDAAVKEGVHFEYLVSPKSVEMKNDILTGLKFVRVDPTLNAGKFSVAQLVKNSDFVMEADSIVLAISQKPNLFMLGENYSKVISERGLVKEEIEKGIEALPGIFAAGDAITGPRSIVSALASGRRAAEHIDNYINKTVKKGTKLFPVISKPSAGVKLNFDELKRQKAKKKIPLNIEGNFELIAEPLSLTQAKEEIDRCMRCNNNIEIDSKGCIKCNYCVDTCPVNCLVMVNEKNKVFSHESELAEDEFATAVMIKDALCIRCGLCVEICPADVISFKCYDV